MTERYEVVNREGGRSPASSMCRWSGVSRSGCYSWRDRPQSATAARGTGLTLMVRAVIEESDGT